jgi:hypothetical protein
LHAREELDQAHTMLGVLQAYAPDGPSQVRVAEYYKSMIAEGATGRDMMIALTGMLNDGLRTGNWPWVIHPEGRF